MRPHRTASAARHGLLVLLLAFAGMLPVACPSIDDFQSAVGNYCVEAADDSCEAEGGGDAIQSADIPLCSITKSGSCHITSAPSLLLVQLATPPPSRAPPA